MVQVLAGHPVRAAAGRARAPWAWWRSAPPRLGAAALAGHVADAARGSGGASRPASTGVALVAALAAAAPIGVLLYSGYRASIYAPRNLLASLPGAALLIGALVARVLPVTPWPPACSRSPS